MASPINIDTKAVKLAFESSKNKDPFPDIPPALLNSADIKDYAEKAFILSPFYLDDEYFKPASYSIGFNGHYLYWDFVDGKTTRIEKTLKEGEILKIKSNSLVYIQLEPFIQLPNYLAARFNLQIKLVYRGLLLGTGPLVDPGWCGYLNIPLHNLTDIDCELKKGDQIIWMEFTKISPNAWHDSSVKNERKGIFVDFKRDSKNRELKDYVHMAEPNSPIQNSLPKVLDKYKGDIEKAVNETDKINNKTNRLLTWFSLSIFLGIAGLVGSVAGFGWYLYNIDRNTKDNFVKYDEQIKSEHAKSIEMKQSIINYNQIIDSLKSVQQYQQKEIEVLRNKVKELGRRK